MKQFPLIVAAAILAAPLAAVAQNAPQAAVIAASAPGKVSVSETVQLQGKIKSIDKKSRSAVIVGANGQEVTATLGDDAKTFSKVRVGDLVTLTYVQAVALELRKVANNGIRERVETQANATSKPGENPAAGMAKSVRVVGNVIAVNQKAQTVTVRGVKRTLELVVNDLAQLKEIKVGDQIEGIFVEAVALEVTPAAPAKKK